MSNIKAHTPEGKLYGVSRARLLEILHDEALWIASCTRRIKKGEYPGVDFAYDDAEAMRSLRTYVRKLEKAINDVAERCE